MGHEERAMGLRQLNRRWGRGVEGVWGLVAGGVDGVADGTATSKTLRGKTLRVGMDAGVLCM